MSQKFNEEKNQNLSLVGKDPNINFKHRPKFCLHISFCFSKKRLVFGDKY